MCQYLWGIVSSSTCKQPTWTLVQVDYRLELAKFGSWFLDITKGHIPQSSPCYEPSLGSLEYQLDYIWDGSDCQAVCTHLSSLLCMLLFQIRRSMQMFRQLTRSPTFSSLLRDWHILKQDVPKGFEKYFPGGKKSQTGKRKLGSALCGGEEIHGSHFACSLYSHRCLAY